MASDGYGGEIEKKKPKDNAMSRAFESINKALGQKPVAKEETLEEKNERIRQKNSENFGR